MATQMLQRRGTTAEWTTINPVLGDGELGWDRDTGVVKIGDGVTAWVDLPSHFLLKSIADAAGDIIVGTGPNAVGRLPIGTPGQRLTVAGDGSLVWQTSPNPHAIIDAAGDLIVGSADDTPARLAKGAIGERLSVKADGSVGWEPLPSAGNPFTAIDAAGDLLVGTGPDAVGRLVKGSVGQQLKIKSDGNLGWETPDTTSPQAHRAEIISLLTPGAIATSPDANLVRAAITINATATTFYTVPAGRRSVVKSILLYNTHATATSEITVRINGNPIMGRILVPAGKTVDLPLGLVLHQNEVFALEDAGTNGWCVGTVDIVDDTTNSVARKSLGSVAAAGQSVSAAVGTYRLGSITMSVMGNAGQDGNILLALAGSGRGTVSIPPGKVVVWVSGTRMNNQTMAVQWVSGAAVYVTINGTEGALT